MRYICYFNWELEDFIILFSKIDGYRFDIARFESNRWMVVKNFSIKLYRIISTLA